MNKVIIVHYQEDPAAIEAFKNSVRHHWMQRTDYLRNAIISITSGLGDLDSVVARLEKDQEAIAMIIEPFYGTEAAMAFRDLLKDQTNILINIFKNVKSSKDTTELEGKWLKNIYDISTFLSTADATNWPMDVVTSIFDNYGKYLVKQVLSRRDEDWTADLEAFDKSKQEIEKLAVAEADGIVKKFTERFVLQFAPAPYRKPSY